MKQILCKARLNKGGIDTFTANSVSRLKKKGFSLIRYNNSDRYFFSEVLNRIRASRALKNNIKDETNVVFIPDHTIMSFINPKEYNTSIVPYVHDILPATTNFSGYVATILAQKYVDNIKKCEKIICNSKTVAKELEERAGYQGQIEVIYQGVGLQEPKDPPSYEEREYDFIYIGGLTPRKNEAYVREFAKRAENHGYKLLAVNRNQLNLPCDTKTDVSDSQLIELIDNSRYYLHPSFQEGFGRGAIEAQRRGVPVIARNNQINNEILRSFYSLEDALKVVGGNEWQKMSDAAIKNAKRFDWDTTVSKLAKAL